MGEHQMERETNGGDGAMIGIDHHRRPALGLLALPSLAQELDKIGTRVMDRFLFPRERIPSRNAHEKRPERTLAVDGGQGERVRRIVSTGYLNRIGLDIFEDPIPHHGPTLCGDAFSLTPAVNAVRGVGDRP